MTMNAKIRDRLAEMQVADRDLLQERRQTWVPQADAAVLWIERQAEHRPHERARCRAGPSLRRARDRIKRRTLPAFALEAAEEFRQAPQVHVGRAIEQALSHLRGGTVEAVAREAESDERVVVRP